MDYIEVKIAPCPYSDDVADVLAALLAARGFDSFEKREDELWAYCPEGAFHESELETLLADFPLPDVRCSYSVARVETKNWNETWEQEAFVPIVLGDRCVIHAPADAGKVPACRFDITILPRMSFGSGHHETTSQLLEEILELPLAGKRVLDMGCGTAVLGILAAKCGAASVRAIDIDDWVCEAAKENVVLNAVPQVRVELGDASSLDGGGDYDFIFANINRNILLADMNRYAEHLAVGGELLMSGFYEEDIPAIRDCAENLGLSCRGHRERHHWVVIRFSRGL